MKKFLVIEDDVKICELVRMYLEEAGFATVTALSGVDGVNLFDREEPDFVILDLGLPGMDGIDVAKYIRKKSNVPILMLTARSEELDRVLGLEIGADDYVTKPFNPRELIARVKAILRRVDGTPNENGLHRFDILDLEFDLDRYTVRREGEEIKFSSTEYRLLSYMASRPGRVFSRAQLLDSLHDDDTEGVLDRTIDVHVKNIRRKLGDDSKSPRYIESVFGIGYRFRESDEI